MGRVRVECFVALFVRRIERVALGWTLLCIIRLIRCVVDDELTQHVTRC